MGIKWAGQDYKVKLTEEPIGDPQDSGRAILGMTEVDFNLIVIDGTLPKTRMAEVLMHELAHVAVGLPEFLTGEVGANMYGILAENGFLRGNFVDSVVDGKATKEEVARILQFNEKVKERQEETPVMGRVADGSYVVTDKAWAGAAARFSPEAWKRSCLLHLDDQDVTTSHHLPVREPNGEINRNACHAAATVLAGGRGGVFAPAGKKRTAARQLVSMYRNDLKEDPPASLLRAGGV